MSEKTPFLNWILENIQEAWAFIVKSGAWLLYTFVGLIGKWSYSSMTGKRMSFIQYLASAGAALYVGYVVSNLCLKNCPNMVSVFVPVSVLSSDKILVALMSFNWKKIFDYLVDYYTRNQKK